MLAPEMSQLGFLLILRQSARSGAVSMVLSNCHLGLSPSVLDRSHSGSALSVQNLVQLGPVVLAIGPG